MSHQASSAEKMTKVFHRDETIFEEGSQGSHMFVVIAGAVRIVSGSGKVVLATLGPGEIFGEMALIDAGVRTAGAVAAEDPTRLMAIDQGRFVYLVSQQPAFALSIMRVLAKRVVAANAQLAALAGGHHGR